MNKKISNVIAALLVVCFSVCLAAPVYAYDPGLTGLEYVSSSASDGLKSISFTHVAVNSTGSADSVTYSVSRTKSFTGSLSGTAEFNAFAAKVSVTAEVGYGQSQTITASCTWSIPAHSTVTCRYGSLLANNSGKINVWSLGKLTNSYYRSANWTQCSYSDKT